MIDDQQRLVEAFARRRDEGSFRRMYRDVTPMIFALAVRLSGSRGEAEDLTQEAWIRAVERFERFDRRSKFSTWLAGILVNCHRESVRRQATSQARSTDFARETANLNDARPRFLDTPAEHVDIERALRQLAPGYREVVVLHDVHGYTHAEIASIRGVREGTSKSQLMRGRAQLRELLTQAPSTDRDPDERGAP